MTNEDLAKAIQAGERDKLLVLWEQIQRFAWQQAKRWAGIGGMDSQDYLQTAFLTLLEALNGWDGSRGTFLSWYSIRLKGTFTEAAGLRTQRDRRDPLRGYLSLDAPLIDDEGDPLHLSDLIPDPAAERQIDAVADQDFMAKRKAAVRLAVSQLSQQERRVLYSRYWRGSTVEQTAQALKIPKKTAYMIEKKAMRQLRHPSNREIFLPWVQM